MEIQPVYDVGIVGGGLAGLSAAIQLSRSGFSVVVFEKEKYPFHKVCGEYISNESRSYLESLGLDISHLKLPLIDTLLLTSAGGRSFSTKLPLGGFGVSRFLLDKILADTAIAEGVSILDNTKVEGITKEEDNYKIDFRSALTPYTSIAVRICCAAYGKRSNLDVRWKRKFTEEVQTRLNNYIAVKYHIHTTWKSNVIGLHNFNGGYCGVSKIEGEKYCLCYMTKAVQLKSCRNDIHMLEETVLHKNVFLKRIFDNCTIVHNFPITISQISFAEKEKVHDGILMLGDAAGLITPLCGNGMSIALHSGKIAAQLIIDHLQGRISREEMETSYRHLWDEQFGSRFKTGRLLQSFFGKDSLSNSFVRAFQLLPFLSQPVIRRTHGKIF